MHSVGQRDEMVDFFNLVHKKSIFSSIIEEAIATFQYLTVNLYLNWDDGCLYEPKVIFCLQTMIVFFKMPIREVGCHYLQLTSFCTEKEPYRYLILGSLYC